MASASTVLPRRSCWVDMTVRATWLRSVCSYCRQHCFLPAPDTARRRTWSLGPLLSFSGGHLCEDRERQRSRIPQVACSRAFSVNTACHRDDRRPTLAQEEEQSFEKENIWTIPNVLSAGRILLSPVLGYQVLHSNYLMAFGLLTVAAVSDVVDGHIARHYPSQSSMLGSVLDPLADKCLVSILCITLTLQGLIPLPLTAIILSRDALLVGAGLYLRYSTLPPPRTWSRYWDIQRSTLQVTPTLLSKLNTLLQLTTVGLSLGAALVDASHHPLLHALWVTTAVSTVMSGTSYFFQMKGFRILRNKRSS